MSAMPGDMVKPDKRTLQTNGIGPAFAISTHAKRKLYVTGVEHVSRTRIAIGISPAGWVTVALG
jgi:hypothetical protein